jgi:hypothetical protein
MGQLAVAAYLGIAQLAVGEIAIGQLAYGRWVLAQLASASTCGIWTARTRAVGLQAPSGGSAAISPGRLADVTYTSSPA